MSGWIRGTFDYLCLLDRMRRGTDQDLLSIYECLHPDANPTTRRLILCHRDRLTTLLMSLEKRDRDMVTSHYFISAIQTFIARYPDSQRQIENLVIRLARKYEWPTLIFRYGERLAKQIPAKCRLFHTLSKMSGGDVWAINLHHLYTCRAAELGITPEQLAAWQTYY